MNCPKCQYALSAFDKSCPRCVQTQPATATAAVAAKPRRAAVPTQQAMPEPAGCVACGNPAIQKVSGLYRGGVWSAEAVGVGVGYGRTSGGQSFTTVSTSTAASAGGTGLAQALAPPRQPHRYSSAAHNTVGYGLFAAVVMWLAVWLVFALGSSNPRVVDTIFVVVASLATVIPLAAIPAAVASTRRQRHTLPILLQRWQVVTEHWERLYYCPRCDRVFNPQTGQHAPAQAMSGILHQDMLDGTSRL